MKKLNKYILESYENDYLKLSAEDKAKLIEMDREYGELFFMKRNDFNEKDILNLDEEKEKFFTHRKNGIKYCPIIKLGKCEYDTDGIIPRLKDLKTRFKNFKECYLSKFYIECIDDLISWCQWFIDKKNDPELSWYGPKPSEAMYNLAIKTLKENKYQKPSSNERNINAKTAQKMIQKALDDLGYDFEAKIYDNMVPRMNVIPEKILRINKNAKFSDIDIEGLIEHEVKGHVGRRYYGYQTGLYLFVHGLTDRNYTDEGLAIWNSLNNVKKPKPNILFNIAFKCALCYHSGNMNFADLFDWAVDLLKDQDIDEETIFLTILRNKRELFDTKLLGGQTHDAHYFIGYNFVNNLTDKDRDNLLKYNVGINAFNEIDTIKKFLSINKFEPIKEINISIKKLS